MASGEGTTLSAVVGGLVGIVTAYLTTWFQRRGERQDKEDEKLAKVRLQYLNPLRISVFDLRESLRDIDQKNKKLDPFLRDLMAEFETKIAGDYETFALWANDRGHYALSKMYLTSIYLSYAMKVRSELPFITLAPGNDHSLLDHLSHVRAALDCDRLGIWAEMQDSLGCYVRDAAKGNIVNYRAYCEHIFDKAGYPWHHRLADFYKDIHMKSEPQVQAMIKTLDNLEHFLKAQTQSG